MMKIVTFSKVPSILRLPDSLQCCSQFQALMFLFYNAKKGQSLMTSGCIERQHWTEMN